MTSAVGSYATLSAFKARTDLGTAAMSSDDVIESICDQVNMWIETWAGRPLAPWGTAAATAYLDVAAETDHLYVPLGITSLDEVAIARYTGADYETVPEADVFLRPATPDPGWPYTWIELSDVPTTGTTARFYPGKETVRVIGMFGWPAIPDDITDLALSLATRVWFSRQAGQADVVGTDAAGNPVVSRALSPRDRETLRLYTVPTRLL